MIYFFDLTHHPPADTTALLKIHLYFHTNGWLNRVGSLSIISFFPAWQNIMISWSALSVLKVTVKKNSWPYRCRPRRPPSASAIWRKWPRPGWLWRWQCTRDTGWWRRCLCCPPTGVSSASECEEPPERCRWTEQHWRRSCETGRTPRPPREPAGRTLAAGTQSQGGYCYRLMRSFHKVHSKVLNRKICSMCFFLNWKNYFRNFHRRWF